MSLNNTLIEWVKNPDGSQGYTWNPITGCLNGCEYCYARKLANGRLKSRYLANKNVASCSSNISLAFNEHPYDDPFYPRFWEDRMSDLGNPFDTLTWHKKIKGIFVCDMSDLFGIGIPEEWTQRVLQAIADSPHRGYLLTKQAHRLKEFSLFPDNCWVGVTAWDESSFVEAYNRLICIEARTKYISLEPFLGWGRLYEKHACKLSFLLGNRYDYPNNGIDWVIIGAQTGSWRDITIAATKYAGTMMPYGNKWTLQPPVKHVQEIVEACDKAGIPVFLKDNLAPLMLSELRLTRSWAFKDSKLRQEMPNG